MSSLEPYGPFRISWVIAGSLHAEIWAWTGVRGNKKCLDVIPFNILWVL